MTLIFSYQRSSALILRQAQDLSAF